MNVQNYYYCCQFLSKDRSHNANAKKTESSYECGAPLDKTLRRIDYKAECQHL